MPPLHLFFIELESPTSTGGEVSQKHLIYFNKNINNSRVILEMNLSSQILYTPDDF